MKKNVCDDNGLRACTGCGVCAGVCGTSAIKIQLDDAGYYKPFVDESKCVECGVCESSCYRYDENLLQSDAHKRCYAAVNRDKNQLRLSSSGGISMVLMEECIARGYKVLGCAYDNQEGIAQSIIASTTDELEQFYGSKYFQSLTVKGMEAVLKDRTEQRYAIFGTPCQIYGFSQTRKYRRNPEKYLLVDIFCHGCPSMKLWKSYLNYVKKRTRVNSFEKIMFRSKTYAWHEYCFDFVCGSSQFTSRKSKDPFYDIFFGMDIMNEACYDCHSRSSLAYSDIRIGDYWGKRYDTNTSGVSAVVLNTEKGVEFFDDVKDRLAIEDSTLEDILISQSYGKKHTYNSSRRRFLLENLSENNDLSKVYSKYIRMFPLSYRVKREIKAIVKGLPKGLYFSIRKFIHTI